MSSTRVFLKSKAHPLGWLTTKKQKKKISVNKYEPTHYYKNLTTKFYK